MAYSALTPVDPASTHPTQNSNKSITHDALISFEDGRPYRMLKRHVGGLGLTMAEYRAKWGLPSDYPSAAPSYSAKRSMMAKAAGLGVLTTRPRQPSAAIKTSVKPKAVPPSNPARLRGRPKKSPV